MRKDISKTKDKKKMGRPITMKEPWGQLAKQVGGTLELAKNLGVSKSTLCKWVTDVHRVPLTTMNEVERLCHKYGIEFRK